MRTKSLTLVLTSKVWSLAVDFRVYSAERTKSE